jgi:Protein of unknown function (DUF938)
MCIARKIIPQSRYSVNKMLGNPAGDRNKQPILQVLQRYIKTDGKSNLLEISSGVGLHASFFAEHFPNTCFQTSEFEPGVFNSINSYIANCKTKNVLPPVFIDISKDLSTWEEKFQDKPLANCQETFDYMLNINMMHISPYNCSEGLFANSSKLLKKNGLLFTYGPYANDGVLEPESNLSFNHSLRCRNQLWGIRDIVDLKLLAEANSMTLLEAYNLPSNNKCLVWQKV